MHVEVEIANFYPSIASRFGQWLYAVTQSRIHVLVTYGFLRSLAKLDLAESRVGRFASAGRGPRPAGPVALRAARLEPGRGGGLGGAAVSTAPQFAAETDRGGRFVRQQSRVPRARSRERPEPGRSPPVRLAGVPVGARASVIVRRLLGLEDVLGDDGPRPDPRRARLALHGRGARTRSTASRYLAEAYRATDPAFRGRVTVPVLWDTRGRAAS